MRPLNRGEKPEDLKIEKYQDAKPELIHRLGSYCCYCELHLPNEVYPHVEHVQPKSLFPEYEKEWTNLLIACPMCNVNKGNKFPTNEEGNTLSGYLFPDTDDTFQAFSYNAVGEMFASPNHPQETQANKLLKDLDLPKRKQRSDQSEIVNLQLKLFLKTSPESKSEFIDMIVASALTSGYWSVWMTVFKDYPEVTHRLVEAFVGTAIERLPSEYHHLRYVPHT